MRPIASTVSKDLSEEQFLSTLIDVCENHQSEARALSFAFIVYNFQNPSIRKVLRDRDYWRALDELAGEYLSIFYVNGVDKKRRDVNSHVMSRMTMFSVTDDLDKPNKYLRNHFGIEQNVELPYVIFFQVKNKQILDSFAIQLKKELVEESFIELKDHIKSAVESLSEIRVEYLSNKDTIYSLVENGVKNGRMSKVIKTNIVNRLGLGDLISFAKTII